MIRPTVADAVVIDFETHMDKKAKYTLEKMSTRAYVIDPRFDILSIGVAIGMNEPGREIEGPLAVVILGGLLTSMALNLLVLPALTLRYGQFKGDKQRES